MEMVGILSLGTLGVIAAGYLGFKLGERTANIEIDRRKSQEFRTSVPARLISSCPSSCSAQWSRNASKAADEVMGPARIPTRSALRGFRPATRNRYRFGRDRATLPTFCQGFPRSSGDVP